MLITPAHSHPQTVSFSANKHNDATVGFVRVYVRLWKLSTCFLVLNTNWHSNLKTQARTFADVSCRIQLFGAQGIS